MAASREDYLPLVGILRADRSENRRDVPGQAVPPYLPHESETVEKWLARRDLLGAASAHTDAPIDKPASPLDGFDERGPHSGVRKTPTTVYRLVRAETFQVVDNPPHHTTPLPGRRSVCPNQILEWSLVVTPQLHGPRDRASRLSGQCGGGAGNGDPTGHKEIGRGAKATGRSHGARSRRGS